jgi:uncharacterized protein with PQ loop repeat
MRAPFWYSGCMARHPVHPIDRLANANGIITGLALWPQLIKALISGSTGDLSFWAFSIIFLNSAVWTAYAWHRSLTPLKISSVLNLIASGFIIALIA